MKNNNKGFSLIELSIVLIIIGLLVAGITGGASLIKSAQLRSVVTESNTYRTAYNIFYSQFNRVPGATNQEPNEITPENAWQQLLDSGIIEKKANSELIPGIKSKFKNANWYLNHANEVDYIIKDFEDLNILYISGKNDFTVGAFSQLDAYNLDEKLDNGISNKGFVRGIYISEADKSISELVEYDSETEIGKKDKTTSLIIKMDF